MTRFGARVAPNGGVALLTDFGLSDPFVGVMKGVILRRFAAAQLVDLSHGIPPQDVVQGAFWLSRSARWFAPGTVHVAVVDPGVGGSRAALAVYAREQYFLGPDNGLLSGPLAEPHAEVRALDCRALGLPTPSRTFHGRDVFAPAAAELAAGRVAFEELGPAHAPARTGLLPEPVVHAGWIEGQIVAVDHYGNLISNIDAEPGMLPPGCQVRLGGQSWPVVGTYSDVNFGEVACLVNAFSSVEIALRDGNAAAHLGVGRGARVELHGV